jgi:phosphoribosyl 1,2-cyclic phosphodiesterase
MRFASLGSGSRGNALLVESGTTRLLLDCGFGPRELLLRLAKLDIEASQLDAIVVTHEHSDHLGGVFQAAQRHQLDVYLTHGTLAAASRNSGATAGLRVIDSHNAFTIGDLEVQPFPVPHDAREPVQYVFSDGRTRLGVLTDIGAATPHITTMLSGCEALVLECNHDIAMLAAGTYPGHLKQRIRSRFGHLDNQASAALLAGLDTSHLRHLVAAQLSQENNTPALARTALAGAIGCATEWIGVATQGDGFDWREL